MLKTRKRSGFHKWEYDIWSWDLKLVGFHQSYTKELMGETSDLDPSSDTQLEFSHLMSWRIMNASVLLNPLHRPQHFNLKTCKMSKPQPRSIALLLRVTPHFEPQETGLKELGPWHSATERCGRVAIGPLMERVTQRRKCHLRGIYSNLLWNR